MKQFVGCKLIEAELMNRGEYNLYRGWENPKNENPEDEGYLIRYLDGYISWIPKKQFDEEYREYNSGELAITAILMVSQDYKERFRAEYDQVFIRFQKLKDMLRKWDNGELNFRPTCPRSIYELQIRAMKDYIAVLEARAVMENVVLGDPNISLRAAG